MFPCDFAQRGWHDFDNLFAALQTASIFFWTAGKAGFLLEEEKEWGGEEPPQTKQQPATLVNKNKMVAIFSFVLIPLIFGRYSKNYFTVNKTLPVLVIRNATGQTNYKNGYSAWKGQLKSGTDPYWDRRSWLTDVLRACGWRAVA